MTISAASESQNTSIVLIDGNWTIAERQNFAADTGKLRQLVLAFADAKLLEQKTSNPDRYAQLGVDDAAGTTVTIAGEEFEYSVIVGNEAQSRYRYARMVGDEQSWLISADPDLPDDIGEWLDPDVIDVDAVAIRSVTIKHADGEEIQIFKEAEDSNDYQVRDVPESRELSYASVANGMAGVLAGLTLDDVKSSSID